MTVKHATRRELLEGFTACSVIPLEPGLSTRATVEAVTEEVALEREAQMSEPYVCIDSNALNYALYVGDSPLTPLGVAICRHFATFGDFLWLERTQFGGEAGEAWTGVLVQDGLALDEVLNGPRSAIRQMVSELNAPIPVISQHRSLLEPWLPKAMHRGASANWVDISVSPLSSAAKLAKLEPLDDALKTARLKLPVSPTQMALAAALALGIGVGTWTLFAPEETVASLDPETLAKNRQKIWLQNVVKNPSAPDTLGWAYRLLLESWGAGLPVSRVSVEDGAITLFFGEGLQDPGARLVAETWARWRGLRLAKDSVQGPIPGFAAFADLRADGLSLRNPEYVVSFDDKALADFERVYNTKASVQDNPAPMPSLSPGARTLRLALRSPDNLATLAVLSEDDLLRDTFLETLELQVDSRSWKASSELNLSIGGWLQPTEQPPAS